MIDWPALTNLGANVVIVGLFLWYLVRRDKEIAAISERCHDVSSEGHKAIKELTVEIMRRNGNGK